jgi:cobalamin biosynthesis protein CobD/CbiB
METWPTLSIAALWLTLAGLWFWYLGAAVGGGAFTLMGVAFGTICLLVFRTSCRRQPGWLGVLLRFQLIGLAMVALLVLIQVVSAWFVSLSAAKQTGLGVALGALALVDLLSGRRLFSHLRRYSNAKDQLRVLCRRIAAEEVRAERDRDESAESA